MFTAYLRERFPLRIFGLAAVALAAAASWASAATPTPATLVYATACSALLALQFRLWDDLEDRDRDRATHPGRLLVRTPAALWHRPLPRRSRGRAPGSALLPCLSPDTTPRSRRRVAVLHPLGQVPGVRRCSSPPPRGSATRQARGRGAPRLLDGVRIRSAARQASVH